MEDSRFTISWYLLNKTYVCPGVEGLLLRPFMFVIDIFHFMKEIG